MSNNQYILKSRTFPDGITPPTPPAGEVYHFSKNGELFTIGSDGKIVSTKKGSIFFIDTQYNDSNFLSINDTQAFSLPNNKGVVINNSAPTDASNWLTNTGRRIPIDGNGDFYMDRISFRIDPELNNRKLRLFFDIGGTEGVIYEKIETVNIEDSDKNTLVFNIPYFTGSTFLANGGDVKIEIDGNASVYDIKWLMNLLIKA